MSLPGQPPRKTRKRFENPFQYRFITFSCFGRLALFNNESIRDAFATHLENAREKLRFKLFAWVVMPEHVHLLLEPKLPDVQVSKILGCVKGRFAAKVLKRWRDLNAPILTRLLDSEGKQHFWMDGGGYDRNIYTSDEALEKFDYIHGNPVKRGLVANARDWKWSSARWYDGIRDMGWPQMDSNFL